MTTVTNRRIPTWVKVAYSLFVAVLVPSYWVTYSPWNFLYFCDIALLVTGVAIWIESPLVSMQAVAITVPQILWVVDFLCRLIAGVHITLLELRTPREREPAQEAWARKVKVMEDVANGVHRKADQIWS
jgi:hypothetical protein